MAGSARDDLLTVLARERGRELTGYAYLLTGDLPAAEDLVQDALVKVFVRLRSGFTPDTAEAYVRRTILTLYLDGYRRRRLWATVGRLAAVEERIDGPETQVTDQVDLQAALARLAPRERAAVVLRYFDDLPVAQIAERMGLAQGTVKRYLSDAVQRMDGQVGDRPETHEIDVTLTRSARTGH
ncbi:sigma-70 family RNA polymerase sigma factor [Cellulomonas hominis]